jgi:DNA repair protein RadD
MRTELPEPLWPTQQAGVDAFFRAVAQGFRRICLYAATGGGKTRTGIAIAEDYLDRDFRVAWHTNRRMLLEQTYTVFGRHGINAGIRAAGHGAELHHPFQLISVQTEHKRVGKGKQWERHPANLAIFDEAHVMGGPTIEQMMREYLDAGAIVLGLTATPIDIGHLYDILIPAGTITELLALGKLVKPIHIGPDEPDIRVLMKNRKQPAIDEYDPSGEDFSENEARKVMGECDTGYVPNQKLVALHGRVYGEWKRLHPAGNLTLLYAPGIKESVWFAQQFAKAGVRAAHIDGDNIARCEPGSAAIDWTPSKDPAARGDLIEEFRTGRIKVLCNRFVLREGIDIPEIRHVILATIYGSYASYIQTGGRGLRASPGKERVIIQDHGGNWHRHGLLDEPHNWNLEQTNRMLTGMRMDAFKESKKEEPRRCPQCGLILVFDSRRNCPCGFVLPEGVKTRPVITSDGKLIQVTGDVYKKRRRQIRQDTAYQWSIIYRRFYTAKGGSCTFRQASGFFAHEHWYHPSKDIPLMPVDEGDWYREVHKIPTDRLRGPIPDWLIPFRLKMNKKLESSIA